MRRRRRNALTFNQNNADPNKFKEKTYYNYSYANNNGVKIAVIFGALILVIVVVFIIIRINKDDDDRKVAIGGSGTASDTATENTPTPTEKLPNETDDVKPSDDSAEAPVDTGTDLVMPSYSLIKFGAENSRVEILQARLMELGYMENNEPTRLYGEATQRAVIAFQRQHSLKQTGNANEKTLNKMFSSEAKEYELSNGADGDDVYRFQYMLIELGYMDGKPTGYYGDATEKAVRDLQENNDLEATGTADLETIELVRNHRAKRK